MDQSKSKRSWRSHRQPLPSRHRPLPSKHPLPAAHNLNTALPRPRLRQGTICQLNIPSGYGFLKPICTPDQVQPIITAHQAASSEEYSLPSPEVSSGESLDTVLAPEQDHNDVYFRLPPLSNSPSELSSCHTGFMTLQVGDTLEYICNRSSTDRPRAIYTRLVACSSRSEDDMASYLNHLLSMFHLEGKNIDVIVQELVKVPQGMQLILFHPNPDKKLTVLVLRLAVVISNQFQNTVSCSYKLKAREFFHLLARSTLWTVEHAGLCKLLLELQKTESEPSFMPLRWVFSNSNSPKNAELALEKLESEWGAPLPTLTASTKTLVLRILKELPEELPFLFKLIQTLNKHTELQDLADDKLTKDPENSFAMQVIEAIAHAKGVEVKNLNVSWNRLPLLPLVSEIVDSTSSAVHLPVAKLKGSYSSPDSYVDTYFRLLREDAFASLKKGIADFTSGQLDPRDMTIWFGVSAIGIHFEHSLPGILVGLQLIDNKANQSNLPVAGSLLCICDNGGCFRNPIWATAVRCESMSKNITVLFVDLFKDSSTSSSPYLKALSSWARILHASSMVVAESPAYYRAYEPVMKALQQLDAEKMPFQWELVHTRSPKKPPDYLNSSTILNWSCLTDKNSSSNYGELKAGIHAMVTPLPRGFQTSLDLTQLDAVNHVLQNQLAMIQGPPGTGKTFLSVKIVELLLSASTLPMKPVLIVTYKNKALDQFLESCLAFCTAKDIVRVGGRSKSSCYKGDTGDEMHFRFAEAQFLRMSESMQVKKVEIIWNQVLYERYQKVKQQFSAQNKPDDERLVFHGTKRESIDKIAREGFKVGGTDGVPIRCGAAYGPGVYTAANPDISVSYAADAGMMLLSNAVLGKLHEDYNQGGSKDVFVVKRGEQLLPKYIVHFG